MCNPKQDRRDQIELQAWRSGRLRRVPNIEMAGIDCCQFSVDMSSHAAVFHSIHAAVDVLVGEADRKAKVVSP